MVTHKVLTDGTQSRAWMFTYHYGSYPMGAGENLDFSTEQPSYLDALAALDTLVAEGATYLVAGEEICPETGQPHLQGYVQFAQRKRLKQIKGWPFLSKVHLGLPDGTEVDNKAYCSKTREQDEFPNEVVWEWGTPYVVDGGDSNKKRWENARDAAFNAVDWADVIANVPADIYIQYRHCLKRIFEEDRPNLPKRLITDLFPWQEDLRQRLSEPPDDRTILWIYDPAGRKGKSKMSDWIVAHMEGQELGVLPDYYRYAQAINPSKKIFIIDCPKSQIGEFNYAILEKIKDCSVRTPMYEGIQKYLHPNHVVVFSNHMPDATQYSADRLEIVNW